MTAPVVARGSYLNPLWPNVAAANTTIIGWDANGYPKYLLPIVMDYKSRSAALIPTGSTTIPPAI